jgi:cell division transport system permease protein
MNTDSLIKIEKKIKESNIVREVFYQKNLVDIMNSNVKRIGIVILIISLFLIFSVIILIDNTIRLAMYSNRFLIKTMQMVGATRWFIAKPFNIRSVINGIVSALIAIVGILALKLFAESILPELKLLSSLKWMAILCGSILALGIVISLFSTHRSVIKYLRTTLDDLY